MENMMYTLQDYMLHTENTLYIIMGMSLIGMVWFWFFLTGNQEDE
ncbi:sulfate respiration complex protein HmcD [Desulfobacula sp.]